MKKKLITIIAIFLLIILVFLSFYFNKSIIDFLINIDVSNINFLVFYIIVCFFYFLNNSSLEIFFSSICAELIICSITLSSKIGAFNDESACELFL